MKIFENIHQESIHHQKQVMENGTEVKKRKVNLRQASILVLISPTNTRQNFMTAMDMMWMERKTISLTALCINK